MYKKREKWKREGSRGKGVGEKEGEGEGMEVGEGWARPDCMAKFHITPLITMINGRLTFLNCFKSSSRKHPYIDNCVSLVHAHTHIQWCDAFKGAV